MFAGFVHTILVQYLILTCVFFCKAITEDAIKDLDSIKGNEKKRK